MINVESVKQKIIAILNEKGPQLPIQISKQIELSSMFASAILSELLDEKKIKTSSIKIGSSPLYLLHGQEHKLEEFAENLTGMEKTAFLRLKQNKILEDGKQEPAIRVALRSLKDFSIPLKIDEKTYWKYFNIKNEEIKNIMFKPIKKQENRLEKKFIIKKPKQEKKLPAEFLKEIKEFLIKKDIEFLHEVKLDKKEIIAKARINSDLGKISFLLIAKDKKRITETDLAIAYQKAIHEKMPCLFIFTGNLAKTTQEFLDSHKNLLKLERIE